MSLTLECAIKQHTITSLSLSQNFIQ
uniref:Uncharacterized protein n=1 Tax=Arundo donax TaxID=35708 RepID=A0A0A9H0H5_ARUDO